MSTHEPVHMRNRAMTAQVDPLEQRPQALLLVRSDPAGCLSPVDRSGAELFAERLLGRLGHELNLTPEQRNQLEPILQNHFKTLRDIRASVRPQIVSQLEELDREIMSVLDERQKEIWRQQARRLEEHFPTFRGRGRGMGPDPEAGRGPGMGPDRGPGPYQEFVPGLEPPQPFGPRMHRGGAYRTARSQFAASRIPEFRGILNLPTALLTAFSVRQ